jgi:hypothetical protein
MKRVFKWLGSGVWLVVVAYPHVTAGHCTAIVTFLMLWLAAYDMHGCTGV